MLKKSPDENSREAAVMAYFGYTREEAQKFINNNSDLTIDSIQNTCRFFNRGGEMKIETKTVYICETCRCRYDTEAEALACEQSHLVPTSICGVKYLPGIDIPDAVEIKMSDGSVITYYSTVQCKKGDSRK